MEVDRVLKSAVLYIMYCNVIIKNRAIYMLLFNCLYMSGLASN